MACIFVEGFDKFGGTNANSAVVAGLLTAGEWTTASSTAPTIIAPLSATGQAIRMFSQVNTGMLTKTLPASYSRLIGGVRFNLESGASGSIGIGFSDAGTAQASVVVNVATGTISVVRGFPSGGTVVATSTASVSVGTTHYLEWDISFGNTAAYQVWLDGVSILSGSGDTTATANNSANGFVLVGTNATQVMVYDDLYLFDATGSTNNAVLLTSPRVETQFPTGDGAVQFAIGAAIIGSSTSRATTTGNTAANQIRFRPITPTRACTVNSISLLGGTNSTAGVNFRPVIYSDNAGVPGTLLSAGSTSVGPLAGGVATLPLTTPQALVAGTQYWLGWMSDAAVTNGLAALDGTASDRIATSTFASGAPGTAPATSTTGSTVIWGTVTGTGVNWYEVSQNPAQGSNSFVYDTAVGHEDLYTFPALSAIPSAIYAVAVKTIVSKTDAGAKTMSVRCKSGATDSAGTSGTIAPGTSYAWVGSLFPTDPNTSAAWTLTALNAAQAGVKVES